MEPYVVLKATVEPLLNPPDNPWTPISARIFLCSADGGETEIGETSWVRLDPGHGRELWDLFDDESAGTHEAYCALRENGVLDNDDPSFCGVGIGYSYFLCGVETVIDPEYRGHGYGLEALAAFLRFFASESNGLVVIRPAPLPEGPEEQDVVALRAAGVKRLQGYWSRLGFDQVGDTEFFMSETDMRHPWNSSEPVREAVGHG